MQTQFDRFKQWISKKLANVQSQNLEKIHEELDVLWDAIEDMHTKLFPSMPIIKDIVKKDEPDIWGVKRTNTATVTDGGERARKNIKTRK